MYYIGIDVAKQKSDYCIIDSAKKIRKSFSSTNNKSGLEKSFEEIMSVASENHEFSLALEATGNFWQPVYYFFKEHNYDIILLNPYSVKHFSQMRLSRTKTDKMDAYQIACCVESGYAKKSLIPDDKILCLREIVRTKEYIAKQIYSLKRRIMTCISSSFVEYQTVFAHVFSITSLAILKKYPSAHALAVLQPDDLIKVFRSIKGNNNVQVKAQNIIDIAQKTVTPIQGIKGKEISLACLICTYEDLLRQQHFLELQIEQFLTTFEVSLQENEVKNELNPIQAVLTTPGVGIKTIAVIIASCGDLSVFQSSTAFIGYIGLYPQQYQSGKMNRTFSHKKSIPLVKKQLYCASVACLIHNNELRQVYSNALSKGASKKEALCKVSHKLARIIWHLYNHKCKYEAQFVFSNKLNA